MFKQSKKTIVQHLRALSTLRYWTLLVCTFFLLLTAILLFSSWLFIRTTESLDAEVLPTFESNAAHIRAIEADIVEAERAIRERTGGGETASQNRDEVVE